MTSQLDSTGVAAVDHNYFWQPIDTCPRGVKVQLISKRDGVAIYGTFSPKQSHFDYWAPLPKFERD
jgi:hypothetical protein